MKEHKVSNLRKIKLSINKISHFFTVKIWEVSAHTGVSAFKKGWYKISRILSIAIEKFSENHCSARASDLTYYTLFAIVPFFAIAYGVAILLGMETHLNAQIYSALGEQGVLSEKLIEFAQKTISETRGGLITIIASTFFLWSIFSMLSNIEATMNKIWNVHKQRKFIRRMLGFLLFILIGPTLLVLGSAANIFISANIINFFPEVLQESLNFLTSFLVPISIFSILFFIIYQSTPNRSIRPRSSFFAAIIAGTAFQFLQYYYFNIQMSISAYNSIYGSFAALPLLLIWLRLSWIIVLFGAELAYGIEHERGFIASRQSRQPSRKP
ncbi:MAG: YihY/virulence factor BrkB family protein [Bacteroidales bacterium]|nr:YihY/virulence factor BrkB family protein [Bacteroidales bacterium]